MIASGGIPSYTYTWSSGINGNCLNNISAGSYEVIVSDGNNCNASQTVVVADLNGPTISIITTTDVNCFGGSTGSAQVAATGGSSGYSYAWENSGGNIISATPSANNLFSNPYTVTVTDASGCIASTNVIINQPTQLQTNTNTTSPTCYGNSDGSATVTVVGGTSSYSYNWSTIPTLTTSSATGLANGIYTVDIVDGNSCSTSASVTISEPDEITLIVTTNRYQLLWSIKWNGHSYSQQWNRQLQLCME